MLMQCTENLKVPNWHRVKLDAPGIPGGNLTLFLADNHPWAALQPGQSFELTLTNYEPEVTNVK